MLLSITLMFKFKKDVSLFEIWFCVKFWLDMVVKVRVDIPPSYREVSFNMSTRYIVFSRTFYTIVKVKKNFKYTQPIEVIMKRCQRKIKVSLYNSKSKRRYTGKVWRILLTDSNVFYKVQRYCDQEWESTFVILKTSWLASIRGVSKLFLRLWLFPGENSFSYNNFQMMLFMHLDLIKRYIYIYLCNSAWNIWKNPTNF